MLQRRHAYDAIEGSTKAQLGYVALEELASVVHAIFDGASFSLGDHGRRQVDARDMRAGGRDSPTPSADSATDLEYARPRLNVQPTAQRATLQEVDMPVIEP